MTEKLGVIEPYEQWIARLGYKDDFHSICKWEIIARITRRHNEWIIYRTENNIEDNPANYHKWNDETKERVFGSGE